MAEINKIRCSSTRSMAEINKKHRRCDTCQKYYRVQVRRNISHLCVRVRGCRLRFAELGGGSVSIFWGFCIEKSYAVTFYKYKVPPPDRILGDLEGGTFTYCSYICLGLHIVGYFN
jgi:hypothetical protein